MHKPLRITWARFYDPNGKPASAYIVRTFFSDGSSSDALHCANTKEEAFKEERRQREEQSLKWFPGREIISMELLRIDGGIENGQPVV